MKSDKKNYDIESDDILEELQELWNKHSRHIDMLLAEHPEWQPRKLNPSQSGTRRHQLIAEYCVLLFANIAIGLCATGLILTETYYLFRTVGCIILFFCFLMAIHSSITLFSDLLPNPSRVGTARVSRHHDAKQVTALTAVAIVLLVGVAQAPEYDGLAMTKINRIERADVVTNVFETMAKI